MGQPPVRLVRPGGGDQRGGVADGAGPVGGEVGQLAGQRGAHVGRQGAVPAAPAGGSQTATAETSSVTHAVRVETPRCAGVELVQAGEPLHPAVVGQRPAGPARVGEGDGEGGGDPRHVPLLGEPDVGALVVRVVDPLDGGTARGHGHHSTTRGRCAIKPRGPHSAGTDA